MKKKIILNNNEPTVYKNNASLCDDTTTCPCSCNSEKCEYIFITSKLRQSPYCNTQCKVSTDNQTIWWYNPQCVIV